MASASTANSVRWGLEVSWIASRKMFAGVRLNLGFSDEDADGVALNPASPNFDSLNRILDLLIAAKLKCQLGIGGEGPPNISAWHTLAGTVGDWPYNKRPPLGTANALVNAAADIKNQAIELMVNRYRAAGLDPFEYCKVEIWNEPARGGAGAPSESESYWPALPSLPIGTWDSLTNDPGASGDYATINEYLNAEVPQLDFQCLRVIAPGFTSIMIDQATNGLAQELDTYNVDATAWLDAVAATVEPSWGLNCYYNLGDAIIALGPALYAERAVYGRDLHLAGTEDVNCVAYRLNQIRDAIEAPECSKTRITICEAGINPTLLGMVDDPDLPQRQLNYYELGRARLAYLDMIQQLDVEAVILYTASDTASASLADQYGAFNEDLGTTGDVTYSAEIPFAQRCGASTLIPFSGTDYILADEEVLPPRLT